MRFRQTSPPVKVNVKVNNNQRSLFCTSLCLLSDLGKRFLRASCRLHACSFDSLSRYDSASILIISELCTSLSMIDTTQEAFGNISPHSANGLLVVTIVDF